MLETSSDWGDGAPTALTSSGGSSATPSLGAGTPYFDIKINEVSPSEVSGMDVNQIMGILHNLDVDGVTEAAEAHMNLGDKLDQVASRLAQNAHTLAANWQGTAAQAAMDKFQQMHIQTAQLAAQAKQTGQVLHWTAGVMQKYKNLPTPQGESATQADEQTGSHIGGEIGGAPGSLIGDGIGAIAGAFGVGGGNQAKANAQAQKYLTALNQHLVAANNALPSTIGAPTDQKIGGTGLGPAATGGSGGASGAGGVASAPPAAPFSGVGTGSGGGSVRPPHISKFNPAPLPHGGAAPGRTPHNYTPPPGGTLQSYTPPPGGTSTLPPPSTTPPPGGPVAGGNVPTFTPGPVPNGTNVPNRGDGLASDEPLTDDGALPGDTVAGVDGTADGLAAESGADSAIGSEGAVGEIGTADASAMGAEGEGMGFPMTGGSGSGQQDKERQRQAWMNEDADIWGVPKDNVGPVIEGNG